MKISNNLKLFLPSKAVMQKILSIFSIITLVMFFIGAYGLGLYQGFLMGRNQAENEIVKFLDNLASNIQKQVPAQTPTPVPTTPPTQTGSQNLSWGGPDLWDAVNKRRVENGINPLQSRDELCTIASIRLNEQLALGTLDGHEGFSNLPDRRPDLAWIFEKYGTIAEFLAKGGETAQKTVELWENTLGHKKLLTGGEYVWGCIYAQDTFAVAITAY